jgi:hypothetical protein
MRHPRSESSRLRSSQRAEAARQLLLLHRTWLALGYGWKAPRNFCCCDLCVQAEKYLRSRGLEVDLKAR